MLKKVKVEGFQSLYGVELELGQFTVIYGESDVGKSAFFRAIFAVFAGLKGDSYISEGKNAVRISLSDEKGNTVVFTKERGRNPTYKVNSLIFQRVRFAPKEVFDIYKMVPIKVGDEELLIQFHHQFGGLFLVADSDVKKARLLNKLSSNLLLQAARQAELERRLNEMTIKNLESQLNSLVVEEIDWADLRRQFKVLEEQVDLLTKLVEKYELIKKLWEEYTKVESLVREKIEWDSQIDENLKVLEQGVMLVKNLRPQLKKWQEILDSWKLLELQLQEKKKLLEERLKALDALRAQLYLNCPNCGWKISLEDILK